MDWNVVVIKKLCIEYLLNNKKLCCPFKKLCCPFNRHEIIKKYINCMFQHPILEGRKFDFVSLRCPSCHQFTRKPPQFLRQTYKLISHYRIQTGICTRCMSIFFEIDIRKTVPSTMADSEEYIRFFVLKFVRSVFEILLLKWLPIRDLVDMVGHYLYYEFPDSQRKRK